MLMVNQLIGFGAGGAAEWATIGGPHTLAQNSGGWNGFTLRQVIENSGLTGLPATTIRITFQAGTTEGFKIAAAYVGLKAGAGDAYDFASAPTQILFSGAGSTTISAGTSLISDSISLSVGASDGLVISLYADDAANDTLARTTTATTGWQAYYKAGSDATTVDATGYSTDQPVDAIARIEKLL